MKTTVTILALLILFCGLAIAQQPPPPAEGLTIQVSPPMESQVVRGPYGPFLRTIGPAKFWKDSALMQKIGVSEEQVKKIEKIFQDHRLQLIDLHADLEKQEAILEPLVDAEQPEEAEVVAQIDKVAQARANLEKADARMLLAIRRVLTFDQWKKLGEQLEVSPGPGGPYFTRPARRFPPPAATTPEPTAPAPPPHGE